MMIARLAGLSSLQKWKPEHEDQAGTNGIVNIPKMVKQLDKTLYFIRLQVNRNAWFFQIHECL